MAVCPECGARIEDGAMEGLCGPCLMEQATQLGAALARKTETEGTVPQRVFGDYELLEEIARGGMGIVYRARQRSLNRIVAVKLLLFGANSSPEYVKRFRTEASTAASLHHPNIVAIHEVGVHQGEHFLVMDFVDGPNLARFIKDKPLSPNQAAGYLKTIAEAIHYAHQRGILHRDLKPSNVLIDANDQPRVTDFGLARRLEGDSSLTLTGQVLGSPSYMPPEQAGANSSKVDRRSDVYSLGAMLYHMLVGRPPFVGEGLNQILDQVFHCEPVSPRLLNPSVSRDLETICLKCLEKEPARRYLNAQGLAEELDRFLRQEPIHSRPVSPLEQVWRWCRRKPAIALLILLLLIAAAGGVTGILWQLRQTRQTLYLANLHLANAALEEHDLARTQLLLRSLANSPVPLRQRGWEWRYLIGRSRGDHLSILDTQRTPVLGLALSTQGRWLASVNLDGLVKLWDFPTKTEITNWCAHPNRSALASGHSMYDVAFLPNVDVLITCGADRRIRLWEIPSGKQLFELKTRESVGRLAVSSDGRLLAGGYFMHPRLCLWQVSDGHLSLLQDWDPNMVLLTHLMFAADGVTLFAGGPTRQLVRPYDISDTAMPRRLPTLEDSDGPLAVSPDGRWLATARADQRPLRIWALPALTPVATNYVQGSRLDVLKFSPDSSTLAAGMEDGRVVLWSMGGARAPITLLGHEKSINQLEFSRDGKSLLSASYDKTVRVWDLAANERAKWSFEVDGSAHDVSFSPDSKRLISVCQRVTESGGNQQRQCIIQLWDLDARKGLIPCATATNAASSLNSHVSFSPDGSTIAADSYAQLSFFQVPELNLLREFGSRMPCFASERHELVYVDGNQLVRSDSLGRGTNTLATDLFTAVALSPKDSILATASAHGSSPIELRDARDGQPLGPPLGTHEGWVTWLAFSPDGRTLASAGWEDGWIGIWDVPSRRLRSKLRGNNGSVYKVAFSPDGLTLATCGSDDSVRLWNVARLQEVAQLQGHRGPVNAVAFSPDGRWLASASADGTLRLWLAPTLEEIAMTENRLAKRP